jgi:hypothetical protein
VQAAHCSAPSNIQPICLLHCCPQALEEALAAARGEAAALAHLRTAADREAAARLSPLQAGGMLALLPLLQCLYFAARVLLWLAGMMERLGFR